MDIVWKQWGGVDAADLISGWTRTFLRDLESATPTSYPDRWAAREGGRWLTSWIMSGDRLLTCNASWKPDKATWEVEMYESKIVAVGDNYGDYR